VFEKLALRLRSRAHLRDYGSHEHPTLRHRPQRRRLGLDRPVSAGSPAGVGGHARPTCAPSLTRSFTCCEPVASGIWISEYPAIPGCVSQGSTRRSTENAAAAGDRGIGKFIRGWRLEVQAQRFAEHPSKSCLDAKPLRLRSCTSASTQGTRSARLRSGLPIGSPSTHKETRHHKAEVRGFWNSSQLVESLKFVGQSAGRKNLSRQPRRCFDKKIIRAKGEDRSNFLREDEAIL
jgi:hypothetical protein